MENTISNGFLFSCRSLRELRVCYEDVFAQACTDGGKTVADLMSQVFEDPLYLRYRFKPDCALHQGAPYATTGTPPPSTRAPPVATRKPIKKTPSTNEVEPKYVVQDRKNGGSRMSGATSLSLGMTSSVVMLVSSFRRR